MMLSDIITKPTATGRKQIGNSNWEVMDEQQNTPNNVQAVPPIIISNRMRVQNMSGVSVSGLMAATIHMAMFDIRQNITNQQAFLTIGR